MHRGTYGKIPVIMGDYDTELDDNKSNRQPRSWYSNNEGRLFFIDLNGDAIDVFSKIIKIHEESGHHERLDLDEGFKLKLPYASNYTIIQKTGGDGYNLNAPLLPLNYGGTYNNSFEEEKLIICIGDKLQSSDKSISSIVTTDMINKLQDQINNLSNNYVTNDALTKALNPYIRTSKVEKFVNGLPEQIIDMIFPIKPFNGIGDESKKDKKDKGVQIRGFYLSGDHNSRSKNLVIKINRDTGWGITPAGGENYNEKGIYNRTTNYIGVYGGNNTPTTVGNCGSNWDGIPKDTSVDGYKTWTLP